MTEKDYEKKIIEAMRDAGFYAYHMDCSIPGFPDIFSVSPCGDVLMIEVKLSGRGKKIDRVFEPSQPIFYYEMEKRNAYHLTVILACGEDGIFLYTTKGMLKRLMDDKDIQLPLKKFKDVKEFVLYILGRGEMLYGRDDGQGKHDYIESLR